MSSLPPDKTLFGSHSQRLVAVAQFCSLVSAGVAGSKHYTLVARSACALAKVLANYLCLSRLKGSYLLLREVSPSSVRRRLHSSPSWFTGVMRVLTMLAMLLFRITDKIALLANEGVLSNNICFYTSRLIPSLLFYCNLMQTMTSAVLLKAVRPISFEATDTRNVFRKRYYLQGVLSFLEGVGLMTYAMTLFPRGVPPLAMTLHEKHLLTHWLAVAASSFPPALSVSTTTQGLIGLAATLPSFFMSP
ncbi:hypothetical protein, conserved [Trypanosoma brucei gambiense DAL972]|uniref:Gim5A protein n=1 Tax=Trypanosoma brucei gambiense (strain MHOM/CI/86/DAL972) TaxID=679716 RepID=C9ZYW7_TRYB9|nr:hypothetical protein, conserved [Trypanosoma brucei gambiense DAL972]CBH14616.1 hypothetical protein, conserved [Trypanosoma brucei gambiense DAL972]|eukprot:XP_011776882.1 hypothetical protein, conserved [Trypanosoma brucei gambiense DAL972]